MKRILQRHQSMLAEIDGRVLGEQLTLARRSTVGDTVPATTH